MAGNPDELIRPAEAAAILGISVHALSWRARSGGVPCYRNPERLQSGWRWYRRGDIELIALRPLVKLIVK